MPRQFRKQWTHVARMERSAIRDCPPFDNLPGFRGVYRRARIRATRWLNPSYRANSIRPHHLEHGFGADFKIVALAARSHDRARQPGLVGTPTSILSCFSWIA